MHRPSGESTFFDQEAARFRKGLEDAQGFWHQYQCRSLPRLLSAAPKDAKPDAIEVIVNPQQTLSGISVRRLGAYDDELLRRIEELNPGLQDPDKIHPGEKLFLPRRHSPDGRSEEEANK